MTQDLLAAPDGSKQKTGFSLWLAGFLLILAVHAVWEILNETPPVWDMAHHQLKGWEYLEAWQRGTLWRDFPVLTSYHPPLYYLQEAVLLLLFSDHQFLALGSNLPGLLLLSYCTFRLAGLYASPVTAAGAGWLVLWLPLVAWLSRESLLEVPLAGWVAAAVFLVVRSGFLQRKGWSLLLGLAMAAGMLTKWTFFLFLFPVLAYAFLHTPSRRRFAVNLGDALLLATPLVFWWYLPNLNPLLERFLLNPTLVAREGDPTFGEPLAWIYYPRSLSSYYLFLPLTVFFVWGGLRFLRGNEPRQPAFPGFGLMMWSMVGGIALLTLLNEKDPRYVIPLASPLAVSLAYFWRGHPRLWTGILTVAAVQFLSVSFSLPVFPSKLALFAVDPDPDYRGLRQEWVLYESRYYDVSGPPRRESWPYAQILERVFPGSRIGFVPEMARFHSVGLRLQARKSGAEVEVFRLGDEEISSSTLEQMDFIVGKTGFQGISYLTRFNDQVYRRLSEQGWVSVGVWEVADGARVILWQNPRHYPGETVPRTDRSGWL